MSAKAPPRPSPRSSGGASGRGAVSAINPPGADTPPGSLQRWAPGLLTLLHYQRAWLLNDLLAGLVLTAVLVPVGMGYAEASGVPAIHGL